MPRWETIAKFTTGLREMCEKRMNIGGRPYGAGDHITDTFPGLRVSNVSLILSRLSADRYFVFEEAEAGVGG